MVILVEREGAVEVENTVHFRVMVVIERGGKELWPSFIFTRCDAYEPKIHSSFGAEFERHSLFAIAERKKKRVSSFHPRLSNKHRVVIT